jgi:ketosteroid isomerase-like protein
VGIGTCGWYYAADGAVGRRCMNARTSGILTKQLTKPRPLEAAMTDVDDFLAEIHPRLVAELRALHDGDPEPRLAMWSTKDPVTLFGAAMSGRGWDQVRGIFRSIASRWSDCTDQRVEILAAGVSGDLAYTVELEHTSVSVDGVPVEPYTLRVTQVYRREGGDWKVVHRHGDQLTIDQGQSLPGQASTA